MALDSNPYRAFVASTFEDLIEHRKRVVASLRQAGIDTESMEEFSVSSKAPRDVCAERMRRCQVCILLVGLRRGACPPGETESFTQIEYEEARRLGVDVLPFLLKETPDVVESWDPRFDDRLEMRRS